MGPRPHRRRLAAASALVPVLILSGCGQDSSTSSTVPTSTSNTPTAAAPLFENVPPLLGSVREEFGEVPVIVLFVFSDHAILTHVDQSATYASLLRHTFRDGAWTDRRRDSCLSPRRPLSLDEINPDTVEAAIEAAPGASELTDAEVDHVGIGASDTGEQEYVVSLTSADGVGSVIFSSDLRVRETSAYR